MEERGINTALVAGLAGVSRSVVHDWLAGRSPQDLVAVGKLAKALNLVFIIWFNAAKPFLGQVADSLLLTPMRFQNL